MANRSKSLNKIKDANKQKQKQRAISRSKSPKTAKNAADGKKRNVSFQTRQLAFKYKKDAEESKRKRLGDNY